MKTVCHASSRAVLALFASLAMPAIAANECSVQYGYYTQSGMTRQNQTQTVTMNAGQTLSVNRSNMNFVRSTGTNKVDVTLQGAINNNFTLDKDKRDPSVGFYLSQVTLVKLLCTQGASAVSPSTPELLIAQLKQANTAVAQIAQQLKSNFNQTGQQVATLLKGAGYTASQIAGALVSAFNATGTQVAAWLKAAGYTGEQVAAALKAQFNATATQAAGWLKSAFDATGAQVAAWLKATGATAAEALKALKDVYNLSDSAARQIAQGVYGLTGQAIDTALAAAGYVAAQANRAVAAAMELRYVLRGSSRLECDRYPSGTLYGVGGGTQPLPLPATGTPQTITFLGNAALAAATAINDLPSGSSYAIRERGPCFFVADITVPSTARDGVSGQAVLMSTTQPGPGFSWRVGPVPSSGGTPISVPRASTLQVTIDPSTLYKVGSATTVDSNGDNYTALPQDAPHCQTVAAPNPPYTASNAQNASRANIKVPNIAWQVRNTGSTAAHGITVDLLKRGQVVATRGPLTISAGGTLPLDPYSRPQNHTCVAKLGAGGECYHCGQPHVGWNDNEITARLR